MNCQPGDLAVIVRMPGPRTACLLGRVIRVTQLVVDGGDPCWLFEGPPLMRTPQGAIALVEDEFLRPIRPGGVSEDEVRELYAPQPRETAFTHKPVHAGHPGA